LAPIASEQCLIKPLTLYHSKGLYRLEELPRAPKGTCTPPTYILLWALLPMKEATADSENPLTSSPTTLMGKEEQKGRSRSMSSFRWG